MSMAKELNALIKSELPTLRNSLGLAADASHSQVNKALYSQLGGKPTHMGQLEPYLRPAPRVEAGWNADQAIRRTTLDELTARQSTATTTLANGERGSLRGPGLIGSNKTAEPVQWPTPPEPSTIRYSNGEGPGFGFFNPKTKVQTTAGSSGLVDKVKEFRQGTTKPFDSTNFKFEDMASGPGGKLFGGAADSVFDKFNGVNSLGGLMKNSSFVHAIAPGVAGAATGALAGFVGQEVMPNNMRYNGFLGPAFQGAVIGGALAMARPVSSGMTRVLNKTGMEGYQWLKGPTKMVQEMSHNKLYKGASAIAAGSIAWGGTHDMNLTRPINAVPGVY